jgi:hypothetical protein
MSDDRPWTLVAPWYRWSRPGVPSAGRGSRPVIQKYDTSQLVNEFLRDPQHSLKFTDDDYVHQVKPLPPLTPALFKGLPRRLSSNTYVKTDVKKLFLDTHKRFYLVVCELHCDAPGFPSTTQDQVCEAGFVVRRRVLTSFDRTAAKAVEPILKNIAAARSFLGQIEKVEPEKSLTQVKKGLAPRGEAMLTAAVATAVEKNKETALSLLETEKAKFTAWTERFRVALQLQGWKPLRDRIGQWASVEEEPATLTESAFPLYPLIPDPRNLRHAGKGRSLYFGLIPTASADTDDFGTARFDETTQYEIRCYVRRHKPGCPKKNPKPDCHGPLVWSAPTEVYQLAPHFDLVGTSNRPVSIQLPDLAALQAQAAVLPPNQLAPVRMVSPPNSNLEVNADADGNITSHGISGQICSFSIPLITIVATFVFKLFLPVVTLLFGLFFLLKLKFCIPPSVEIAADVKAELDLKLPSVEVDFAVSVEAEFDLGGQFGGETHAALTAYFGPEVTASLESGPQGVAPAARAKMVTEVANSSDAANAPPLTAKLEYETPVTMEVSA